MADKVLVVTSKSGVLHKTAKNTGRPYEVKFLTCTDPNQPGVAFKLSIYPRSGEWPAIFVYSTISVPCREMNPGKVDPLWDLDLDGKPYTSAFWVNGFKQDEIKILGRYSQMKTVELDLAECTISFDHIENADGAIKIDADELGFKSFPPILRQNTLEGTIKITGEFQWRLHRVNAGFPSDKPKYERQLEYRHGSIDLEQSDLGMLRQVVLSGERDEKLARIMSQIKSALAAGRFMSASEVNEMLTLEELYGIDAEKILYSATFRKDYEPRFFKSLKESHDAETKIFYSENGFVFHIGRCWVWEEPKYGAATYLFDDKKLDVEALVKVLASINKLDIIQKDEVKAVLGFKRRVIHPKDADNEAYYDRWLGEVQQKL